MKKNIFIIIFSILTLINIFIFVNYGKKTEINLLDKPIIDLIADEFKFNENDEDEWNIFCEELLAIENLQSLEFKNLINIKNVTDYLLKNNISSAKQCLNYTGDIVMSVKNECIFNKDNGIQNIYLGLFFNNQITQEILSNNMLELALFYKDKNQMNSISVQAIHDKISGKMKDKSYCSNILKNNILISK